MQLVDSGVECLASLIRIVYVHLWSHRNTVLLEGNTNNLAEINIIANFLVH